MKFIKKVDESLQKRKRRFWSSDARPSALEAFSLTPHHENPGSEKLLATWRSSWTEAVGPNNGHETASGATRRARSP